VRLDLFLKASRLSKRRSLAKALCDKGLVRVNAQTAKASKEVKAGDTIQIESWNRRLIVKVLQVPEGALKKEEADGLYEVLEDVRKGS